MKIRILAAGTRMPEWVNAGVADYLRRCQPEFRVAVEEIALGHRGAGDSRAVSEEGKRMLTRIRDDDYVVALEVSGRSLSTGQLAAWFEERMRGGSDLVLLIGGPDGLAQECRRRANLQWSLSTLTLPHGLVRVVVAEQLYRVATILRGHPYHRA